MNDRQLGIIKFGEQLIRESPAEVAKILSLMSFIPVKVELNFDYDNVIKMMGISTYFAQKELGSEIPEYVISVRETVNEDEERTISIDSVDRVQKYGVDKSISQLSNDINKNLDK